MAEKSFKNLGMEERLYQYMQAVSLREPEILRQLREETARHPSGLMQITPEQGQFMALLVQMLGAKKTLEIGVFTGYSSLAVALALPAEGRIVACENNEEYAAIARGYWERSGVAGKIELRIGLALDTLDSLMTAGEAGTFDFVFIDADKKNYLYYYERSLALLRPGGLMAIDNTLWSGRVADPGVKDSSTQNLRTLNEKMHKDERISLSLVPIADGVSLALKR